MQNNLTAKQAISYISSRDIVEQSGVYYTTSVVSVNFHEGKYIVNFKAMTMAQLEKAEALLDEGKWDEASNQNLSTNVFADAKFIPAVGERVKITADHVELREGGTDLRVTSIAPLAVATAKKASSLKDKFANLLAEEESAMAQARPQVG